jgi:hypothetical protein
MRALIERVCTSREVEALKLRSIGYGTRRIGRALGISPRSVRDRLDGAARKIQAELAREGERRCPSPGCPELLAIDKETRVWRCPMHGPMELVE